MIKSIEQVKNNKYDVIIVGSGISGSVAAQLLDESAYNVLIVERRNHIGGNIYTERRDDIDIHKYGAHIFHTNNDEVYSYLSDFAEFNDYRHQVKAIGSDSKLYQLPFNLQTFAEVYNRYFTVEDAKKFLNYESNTVENPSNLEEQAQSLIGKEIYEKLIKYYTEKQWGRDCKDIPASVIKRLPVRFSFDNTYFNNAKYQGIPTNGYTELIENLTSNVDVLLNTDFVKNLSIFENMLETDGKIIYTGAVDELCNYEFGQLEYRSLKFETEKLNQSDYQGTSVVNDCRKEVSYTRIIEHKHFNDLNSPVTYITKEYAVEFKAGENIEPAYPISDNKNKEAYEYYVKYLKTAKPNYLLLGRLAEYKYFDMDKAVKNTFEFLNTNFDITV